VYRKLFLREFVFQGLLKGAQDVMLFLGPVLLNRIINYIQSSDESYYIGLGYVIAMFTTSTLQSMFLHQYFWKGFKTGMKVRTGTIAAVYQKSFYLSNKVQ
jgi:hypothetical protein